MKWWEQPCCEAGDKQNVIHTQHVHFKKNYYNSKSIAFLRFFALGFGLAKMSFSQAEEHSDRPSVSQHNDTPQALNKSCL